MLPSEPGEGRADSLVRSCIGTEDLGFLEGVILICNLHAIVFLAVLRVSELFAWWDKWLF